MGSDIMETEIPDSKTALKTFFFTKKIVSKCPFVY